MKNKKNIYKKNWSKSFDPHTPNNLNYDNDNSIGVKIIPSASYKKLKNMYPVERIAHLRVKIIDCKGFTYVLLGVHMFICIKEEILEWYHTHLWKYLFYFASCLRNSSPKN